MKFIIIFITLFTVQCSLSAQSIAWIEPTHLNELMENQPKKIFVDLTAKWCGWCKVMDNKTFSQEEVYGYVNENFYAIKLDVDKNEPFELNGKTYTARSLAKSQRINGLPGFLVISEDISAISSVTGFKKPKEMLSILQKLNR